MSPRHSKQDYSRQKHKSIPVLQVSEERPSGPDVLRTMADAAKVDTSREEANPGTFSALAGEKASPIETTTVETEALPSGEYDNINHSPGRPGGRTGKPAASAIEKVWSSGFIYDANTEGQIRRLKDSTTVQRNSKSRPLSADQIKLGDDYEVLALLGQGGMGFVYKVKDKRKNQIVAVKVVRPELATDERALKRFEQEAEAARGLIHPNLVPVYAQGVTADGAPYLVMEYQEGTSLDKVLKQEKSITADRAVEIFMQICDALEHAHAKGIVHRDLKPSNVVLTRSRGNKDLVRLVDFGIAKVLASPESRETFEVTNTGELFGSPSYMSPEQCMGYRLDARSDIYSLGCVMYEVLSGNPPFVSDNPVQTIVKHLSELPQRLLGTTSEHREIPANLEALVLRCLEKDPRNRYQSMEQLRHDLGNIQTGVAPVFYSRAREAAGPSMPLLAKVGIMVVLDLFCISAAFDQYDRTMQSFNQANKIVATSDEISRRLEEATLNLQTYNLSKSPGFMEHYNTVLNKMENAVAGLSGYCPNDTAYQASVQVARSKILDTITLLNSSKFIIESYGADKSQTDADKVAIPGKTRFDPDFIIPLEHEIRSSLIQSINALLDVTHDSTRIIRSDPPKSGRSWLELEMVALLFLNIYIVLGLGKSLDIKPKMRLWQKDSGD